MPTGNVNNNETALTLEQAVEKLNQRVESYGNPNKAIAAYNREVKTKLSRVTLVRSLSIETASLNTTMTFLYVFENINEKGGH
ncbi:hypothetical protein [Aliivibrio salmonicida]|uniref:hypothetical protein n=1 Tax=Aliivibrio salmonicida TaxID=40269 RepID=UPI003D10C690